MLVPREIVNDDSVIVSKIFYRSGAMVSAGQVLFTLETSKTNVDVEAPHDGELEHGLTAGDEVSVGGFLCRIGEPCFTSGEPTEIDKSPNQVEVKRKFSKSAIK